MGLWDLYFEGVQCGNLLIISSKGKVAEVAVKMANQRLKVPRRTTQPSLYFNLSTRSYHLYLRKSTSKSPGDLKSQFQ